MQDKVCSEDLPETRDRGFCIWDYIVNKVMSKGTLQLSWKGILEAPLRESEGHLLTDTTNGIRDNSSFTLSYLNAIFAFVGSYQEWEEETMHSNITK